MKVAEDLYQRGLISYPRTETDSFNEGIDLIGLLSEHIDHPIWGDYARKLVNHNGFQQPLVGSHNDNAHPPIHPTKSIPLDELRNPQEMNIYELIVRHYLACVSKNALGDQTNVEVEIGEEEFTTTGLIISERNWLDIYKWEKWNGRILPSYSIGDIYKPSSLLLRESKTQPPPLLSESDLIGEMDRYGIGTDATIAEHISKIQEREYAVKDGGGRFRPTLLGLALYEAYDILGYSLTKPFLRANMESDCSRIARGEVDKNEVIKRHIKDMRTCFERVTRESNTIIQAVSQRFHRIGDPDSNFIINQRDISNCGSCGNMMELRSSVNQNTNNTNNNNNMEEEEEEEERKGGRNNRYKKRKRGPKSQSATHNPSNLSPLSYLHCIHCSKSYSIPYNFKTLSLYLPPHNCPLCNFQIVQVQTNLDQTFSFCPSCYSNPPSQLLIKEDIEDLGEMKLHNINKEEEEEEEEEEKRNNTFNWRGNIRCCDCTYNSCPLSGRSKGDEVYMVFS